MITASEAREIVRIEKERKAEEDKKNAIEICNTVIDKGIRECAKNRDPFFSYQVRSNFSYTKYIMEYLSSHGFEVSSRLNKKDELDIFICW